MVDVCFLHLVSVESVCLVVIETSSATSESIVILTPVVVVVGPNMIYSLSVISVLIVSPFILYLWPPAIPSIIVFLLSLIHI